MTYLTLPERRIAERASRYGLAFDRARRGLARDQEGDLFADLVRFLEDKLDPRDLEHVSELLARYEEADAADAARRRRLGRDDPPPFAGRPRPGGTIDPLDVNRDPLAEAGLGSRADRPYDREGQDRALRRGAAEDRRRIAGDRMAYDARGEVGARGFDARFPSAQRIRVG